MDGFINGVARVHRYLKDNSLSRTLDKFNFVVVLICLIFTQLPKELKNVEIIPKHVLNAFFSVSSELYQNLNIVIILVFTFIVAMILSFLDKKIHLLPIGNSYEYVVFPKYSFIYMINKILCLLKIYLTTGWIMRYALYVLIFGKNFVGIFNYTNVNVDTCCFLLNFGIIIISVAFYLVSNHRDYESNMISMAEFCSSYVVLKSKVINGNEYFIIKNKNASSQFFLVLSEKVYNSNNVNTRQPKSSIESRYYRVLDRDGDLYIIDFHMDNL